MPCVLASSQYLVTAAYQVLAVNFVGGGIRRYDRAMELETRSMVLNIIRYRWRRRTSRAEEGAVGGKHLPGVYTVSYKSTSLSLTNTSIICPSSRSSLSYHTPRNPINKQTNFQLYILEASLCFHGNAIVEEHAGLYIFLGIVNNFTSIDRDPRPLWSYN